MKKNWWITGAVVVVLAIVALVVGILQSGGGHDNPAGGVAPTPAAARQALAGSPAPLAALHGRANALLPIGRLESQIRALRGYPIVLNVWGSWCNPCREEFPVLQRVAAAAGRRVADVPMAANSDRRAFGALP